MRLLTPYWPARRTAHTDIFREMERFFDDLATVSSVENTEKNFLPAYQVSEDDQRYSLSVDLPGVKKEDIKIEINENVLTLGGERKRGEIKETFTRNFTLPNSVDGEKIEAHYEDGVLQLSLPKTPVAKARRIEIQSAKIGDTLTNTSSH